MSKRRPSDHRSRRPSKSVAAPPRVAPAAGPSSPLRFAPAALGVALALFGLVGAGPSSSGFVGSVLAAGALLVAGNLLLLRSGRGLSVTVDLRKQHYVQALAHTTLFLWWGLHLPFDLVRDHYPLLGVQLAFAYGFDLLLGWRRRGAFSLGFGPFPIIFSTNLFLWFKADWFVFQFAMIAVGFSAKELLRWERDGKKVHIFNPSSLPLALTALLLIVTGATDVTYGPLIANSQGIPPHMHLVIFLVALPGQLLFGVASMTVSAVATTYLFGLIFRQVTGTYYFFDVDIPIPVFLGMHLLFTDPSTSPKTELGRILFGMLYGLSTVALYAVFMFLDAPTLAFYDKLLQVPLMNLSVRAIDRFARSPWPARLAPERLGRSLRPQLRFVAYTSLWVIVFTSLITTRSLGDRHPGQWLPYWIRACEAGSERACAYASLVEQGMCGQGSGWACNEAGILGDRSYPGLLANMDERRRMVAFQVGCEVGFEAACHNLTHLRNHGTMFEHAPPTLADYPVLLRGTRLGPVTETSPAALYALACEEGWPGTCDGAPGEHVTSHGPARPAASR